LMITPINVNANQSTTIAPMTFQNIVLLPALAGARRGW